MNNIIEVKNLSKNYHNLHEEIVALKDISFSLKEGEYLAIIGPSGCGKSTILSILADISNKTSGDILFSNKNIHLGYMLQEDSLFPWLNILDNCLLGLKIKGKIKKEDKDYVIKLLNTYGLKDFIYKYPKELSGGMRQRVD